MKHYLFAGDLFIVRGAIYFFPEVDLSRQRSLAAESLPHELSLAATAVVYLSQKLSFYAARTEDLSGRGVSDGQFREKADARIEELRSARGRNGFADTLPLPTRVSAAEISGIRLGFGGRLSFTAQSDTQDFNVGLGRRRRLRDALWEMGLGRV